MPWCDQCDEYRAPTVLTKEGHCATCDAEVDTSDVKVTPPTKAPWHFWVMVVSLVLYLGWRLIEGAGWLFNQF